MGIFDKIFGGLKKTRDGLSSAVNSVLTAFNKIDEELFEELLEALITADISVRTSEEICARLRAAVKKKGITDPAEVKALLTETIAGLLEGGEELLIDTKPTVILVIGVNGAGKTTTIGKLAYNLKGQGRSVLLGAADTFRAAAIEQLEVWSQRAGVTIVKHSEGSDPSAVVFDTVTAGMSRGTEVLIIDTAGRLHNKKNLMDELSKMNRVIQREAPDCRVESLLVLDAGTGQNALNQAREFSKVANITGLVLTKLDGTARGGIVLSIREELGIPIKYIGVGEGIDDLQPFSAADFAASIIQ